MTTCLCRLLVFAACCLPTVAAAQILYFPNDATIDFTIGGSVYVGKDNRNRNTSPTVSIVPGADIHASVFAYNASTVSMSGGRVRLALLALDTSTVGIAGGEVAGGLQTGMLGTTNYRGGTILMSGGAAGPARIDYAGSLSLHGGDINGAVTVEHGSTLFVDHSGTVFGGIAVGFDSRAVINGGIVFNGVSATSNARVFISGGSIHDFVHARSVSTVDISGGTTKFVSAWGAGTVNLSGSHPEGLSAHDYGVVNMTGGTTGDFSTHNDGTGNLHGGIVFGDLTAFDTSTINVYGGRIDGDIHAWGTVNLYGGNRQTAAASSFLRVAAAAGMPDLLALGSGVVRLFGTGLAQTLLDPDVSLEGAGIDGSFRHYALTGVLTDGTEIDGASLFVQNGTGADFALIQQVPEPRAYLLLALGIAVVLLAARRPAAAARKPAPSFVG